MKDANAQVRSKKHLPQVLTAKKYTYWACTGELWLLILIYHWMWICRVLYERIQFPIPDWRTTQSGAVCFPGSHPFAHPSHSPECSVPPALKQNVGLIQNVGQCIEIHKIGSTNCNSLPLALVKHFYTLLSLRQEASKPSPNVTYQTHSNFLWHNANCSFLSIFLIYRERKKIISIVIQS